MLNGSPTPRRPSALAQKSAPLSCRLARTASTSEICFLLTILNNDYDPDFLGRETPVSGFTKDDRRMALVP